MYFFGKLKRISLSTQLLAIFLVAAFFIGAIILQVEVFQTASNPILKIFAPFQVEITHALSFSPSLELQLNINKTGLGTITSNPAGINCGSDCSEPYEEGTIVNLTAIPERGWGSMGATCDYITDIIQRQLCELDRLRRVLIEELPEKSSSLAVLMDGAKTVSFVFVPGSLLEVSKIGSGTVTSSPGDINCGVYENCRQFYATTTNITLTATPAANAEFIGWEGDCSGTGECVLNMSDHRKVTAVFTQGGQYLLTVNKNNSGTITTTPSGIDCGSDCSEPYEDGTQVDLTVTADSGWVVLGLTFAPFSMRDSNVLCSQLLELDRLRGDSPKTYSCATTMYAAKTATVTFAENRPPNLPSGLDQFKSDGFTRILEEETTNEDIVIFKARLLDSDSIRVKLQVELRQGGEPFSGTEDGGILNSDFVNSGSEATITRANLADGQYHWRARAVDSAGNSSGWQEFGIPGNIDFMVARKEPVIIVPGIMGTRLNRVSDGEEVWPNADKMLLPGPDSYLDELILPTYNPTLVGPTEAISIATTSFLGIEIERIYLKNILEEFRLDGYEDNVNLFTFPYDWRLDIRDSVDILDDIIRSAVSNSPTGKVNIVAHSLGGLVVKNYINQFGGAAIDKLVLVGVPQIGAPKVFKVLNYGDNMDFEFLGFDILNPDRVKVISQNMPAIYELLPSRRYLEIAGGYIKDFRNGVSILNYDQTNQFMLNNASDTRNPVLLNSSDLFHQSLDTETFNASSVYNIVGCQNPKTIGEFRIYDDGKVDITAVDGDGTVPTVSAMNLAEGYNNYFALNDRVEADHVGLVRNIGPVNMIKNIIDGKPNQLPEGITRFLANCFEALPDPTEIIFSIHSPVEMHVYDSENHHLGPLQNGDIELGITSSSYERIGENSFAFVPAGHTYRVVADALSQGVFDLKVRIFNGSVLTNTVTYIDVPLQSDQTMTELDFSNLGGDLNLRIDSNGDGVLEGNIPPTAILTQTESMDIAPPQILITSPATKDYLRSEILPILINATDIESGVSFLKTMFDGKIINSTDTIDLFFEKLGNHKLEVKTVDRAGNPSSREVNFRIIATPESIISDINRAFSLGWIDNRGIKESLVSKAKRGLWGPLLSELNTQRGRHVNEFAHQLLQDDVSWVLGS